MQVLELVRNVVAQVEGPGSVQEAAAAVEVPDEAPICGVERLEHSVDLSRGRLRCCAAIWIALRKETNEEDGGVRVLRPDELHEARDLSHRVGNSLVLEYVVDSYVDNGGGNAHRGRHLPILDPPPQVADAVAGDAE